MNHADKKRISGLMGLCSLISIISLGACTPSSDDSATTVDELRFGRQSEIVRCCDRRVSPSRRATCIFEAVHDHGVCAPSGAPGNGGAGGVGGGGQGGAIGGTTGSGGGGAGGAGGAGGVGGSGGTTGCGFLAPGVPCNFPDGQLCQSCQPTACGSCFYASLFPMNIPVGTNPIVCDNLVGADQTNCLALVNCESAGLGSCALNGLIGCYCSNSTCSAGADGVCAAQINAVAGTTDPAAVIAQFQNPSSLLAQIRNLELSFAHSSCGLTCR